MKLGLNRQNNIDINEPRIGAFICDCGGEIPRALSVDDIRQRISRLPAVAIVESIPYGCSPDGEETIRQRIQSESLNRVVLLGCSPRIMEKRFRGVCAEAGLNPSLLEIVNIRDGCARAQYDDRRLAEKKAWDLIRVGIARARHLKPVETVRTELYPEVAVIGGGIAGMTAALSLAERGIEVKLVEKEADLGGTTWKHPPARGGENEDSFGPPRGRGGCMFPSLENGAEIAEKLAAKVRTSPNIEVLTHAEPVCLSGAYGRYEIELKLKRSGNPELSGSGEGTEKIKAGAILLAVGAQELKPKGHYGYGENGKVITQFELEDKLSEGLELSEVENVVMIQCVGARNEKRPYCGRICCMTAVHNAILLKKKKPELAVTILYRDIPAEPGPDRSTLDEARELGVKFLRFAQASPPEVTPSAVVGVERAAGSLPTGEPPARTMPFELPYDLVVLSTPLVPHESSQALARVFRIPVDAFGFFPDALPNLKPHQYTEPCIRVVGSAHWPCSVSEAMYQAYGGAAHIASLIHQREILSTHATADVNIEACRGCATCIEWCPFDVPVMQDRVGSVPVSFIDPFLCTGCGSCVAHCPSGALKIENLEDQAFYSMVEAALSDQGFDGLDTLRYSTDSTDSLQATSAKKWVGSKVIAFLCEWSGYAAADLAGTKRRSLPPEVIPIRIACAGRISTGLILHAFSLGAAGVLVCTCEDGDCHYLSGNTNCAAVAADTADLLNLFGIEKARFQMAHVNPVDVEAFCQTLEDFVSEIRAL